MFSADECSKYADECEQMAEKAGPEDRASLLKLAKEWRSQAELQRKLGPTVH